MLIRKILLGMMVLLITSIWTGFQPASSDMLDFIPPILAGANRPDCWVDASSGSDTNPGTQDAPFKTITHALSVAGANKTVKVLPGTYDTALGETFPLALQSGQVLTGDIPNKGDGPTPTLIVGHGASGFYSHTATIMGAEGSKVSGFKIGEETNVTSHSAIWIDGVSMHVCYNTLKSPTYSGVMLRNNGTSVIEKNVFNTSSYGMFISSCPEAPIIRNNEFLSMPLPFNIMGADTNAVIRNNTITGSGAVGMQVQHGEPRIENNTFNLELFLCRGL